MFRGKGRLGGIKVANQLTLRWKDDPGLSGAPAESQGIHKSKREAGGQRQSHVM